VSTGRPESATASQVTSKKESKMEDKGNNRAQDIRIENFDVAYGNRCVQGCYFMLFFFSGYRCASTYIFSLKLFLIVSPNYSLNIDQ
jgi:hypothetical protein